MMNLFEDFDKEVAKMHAEFESRCAEIDRKFQERCSQFHAHFESESTRMKSEFESRCAEIEKEFDDAYNRRIAEIHREGDAIRASLDFDGHPDVSFNGFDTLRQNQEEMLRHQACVDAAMRQHNEFMRQVHINNMMHHNMV